MKLSEFIKKRKEELKLTWHDFADAGLGSQTMHNLNNDKQVSIKPVTKEKLATVLQCSQGDIQACLAEMNPLKKVVISKKSLAKQKHPEADTVKDVMEEKPYVAPEPEPDPEEPAEVFRPEEPTDELFPVYHSPYDAEREEGAKEYRQKLRDMVLRVMASGRAGEDTLGDVYTDIGIALVKELVSYDE